MILHSDRIVFIKAMELRRQYPKQMAGYTHLQAEELALWILRYEKAAAKPSTLIKWVCGTVIDAYREGNLANRMKDLWLIRKGSKNLAPNKVGGTNG
jgi:hypothetical protein